VATLKALAPELASVIMVEVATAYFPCCGLIRRCSAGRCISVESSATGSSLGPRKPQPAGDGRGLTRARPLMG